MDHYSYPSFHHSDEELEEEVISNDDNHHRFQTLMVNASTILPGCHGLSGHYE
jgi:hypothetical protein